MPKYYMITGSDPLQTDDFIHKLTTHLVNGTKLIQLRAKMLSQDKYIDLAKQAIKLAKKYDSKLILNIDFKTYEQLNGDGIHLTSDILMRMHKRPLSQDKLVSAACHNEEQLTQAQKIEVDFVTLSPVLPTSTHPEVNHIGWEKFSALCKSTDIPVYALGGMDKKMLDLALSHGAQGIAAISALWNLEA